MKTKYLNKGVETDLLDFLSNELQEEFLNGIYALEDVIIID